MPEIINVTKREWHQFKVAQEYDELSPGFLGDWFQKTLGPEAYRVRQRRGYIVERAGAKKIPSSKHPRVERISMRRFEEIKETEEIEEE